MLYLSTTKGIFRVNPETGVVARLGPLDTSTEALAVASPLGSPGAAAAGDILVAAITPDYGLPMRGPLAPASHQGTVRSADAGRTWSSIPALAGQQITALAAAPLTIGKGGRGDRAPTRPPSGVPASATGPSRREDQRPLVFAGTDPAEILVSEDGGETWTQGQSLREMPGYDEWSYPLAPHTPHVMLIQPHPIRPGVVYAGIEVGGIVRSDDAGRTWRVVGNTPGAAVHPDIHGLAICPAAPDVLYASTPQGVFYSSDGGERWQQRIDGLEPLYCRPIVVHRENPNVAIVVATHGASGFFGIPAERTGGAVIRTEDAGRTWRQVGEGLPEPLQPTPAMAADPRQPGRFYLPLFSGEVLLTDDAGLSWRELASGLPPILRAAVVQ